MVSQMLDTQSGGKSGEIGQARANGAKLVKARRNGDIIHDPLFPVIHVPEERRHGNHPHAPQASKGQLRPLQHFESALDPQSVAD